ncbi:uncharacterized protein MELLADRAFT_123328 [Melampsora larici-populina 98AG31]|uniref:Secreted protein n=1 Tax=Melampsora larici-populina (strain 98AG31 / pathotype 3-4-7) TaxID=747676 RepID=F4S096_MELLP|nr:uncharacterized protein MELLADRAFT_123328 [Melampsora larici-populina 98AG31]EGG01923.1 secreted protein [Melampsora larici-populina 98AG31]
MLSFQSPHKFIVMFISICIIQSFTFTEALKATCTLMYAPVAGNGDAVCHETIDRIWFCPIKQCSKDYRQYAAMSGCIHVSFPGASNQQCTGYRNRADGKYDCWNNGNQQYACPKPSDMPFITCSQCRSANQRK